MSNDYDDELVPIHILIPRAMKREIQTIIPKGMLSHVVRNMLNIYVHKVKTGKANPLESALEIIQKGGDHAS